MAKRRRREQRVERLGQAHGFHKQEQFLSQVKTALEAALQSAASPILNSLFVEDVVPHHFDERALEDLRDEAPAAYRDIQKVLRAQRPIWSRT